jgi:hypothetical protein
MQTLITFPSPVPNEEVMALRKEHKDFIRDEINQQITLAIDSFKPHGGRRLTHWLREWGLAGTAIAVPLTLLTICVAVGIFAASGMKENTQFRTRTEDRLTTIEGDVQDIKVSLLKLRAAESPKSVLDEMSHLDQKIFAKALSALQTVTEQPVSKVNASQAILQQVADKLLRIDPNAPDYWPTVLRFIQFATTGLTPDVPPPGSPPKFILSRVSIPPGTVKWGPVSHTVVLLDGGLISDLRVDHSRVIFTEHPVRMVNVTFTDCVFEMPISNQPPDRFLQQAGRTILASNLKQVTFSNL